MKTNKIDHRKINKSSLSGIKYMSNYVLLFSTLFYNFLGLFFLIYNRIKFSCQVDIIRNIVVLGFGGIGNHIMLTPTLRLIKKKYPDAQLHIIVTSIACADILKGNPNINSLSIKNIGKATHLIQQLNTAKTLKEKKPEIVIAASGTDPVKGSIISLFSGAKIRIGEDWKGRGFSYTHKVKVNHQITELEQNINLLKFLKIEKEILLPKIYLEKNEIAEAKEWLRESNVFNGKKLLGIHPGSGEMQKWKRWDLNKFRKFAKLAKRKKTLEIVFFIGPEEHDLLNKLQDSENSSFLIMRGKGSIRKTAAIINCCDYFVSNDSGLRHIAVALGLNTIGIFGPTSIKKNYIDNSNSKIVVNNDVNCSPCHYKSWWLVCKDERPCLANIDVKDVAEIFFAIGNFKD